ncbi:MAG: methyl-coenzyme M reductase operon protein D [Candidatus Methanomethyliaceae archaeon]|nr:methyl-coenzyme M reductase operon protein D [Candidatus Methanomethyliaceae archaeon]MDW7970857.1 methyl-coenzyme M reductase operon protein D [Nitrososphaerota archaeon]
MSEQEIELMPRRLMSMDRADELVNMLKATGLISEVLLQKHKYYDGKYLVGRFILLINNPPNEVISKIAPICEKMMPYGYDIRVGKFTKPRPTVSDYIREAIYWSELLEGERK